MTACRRTHFLLNCAGTAIREGKIELMDVATRLSKIVFFEVAPSVSALTGAERTALARCVNAADVMTEIYLRQVSSHNAEWVDGLRRRSDAEGRDLLRYFLVSRGPWDQFKTFLQSRADAFLSNEYRESDLAWIDTDGLPFEVTIGPYDTRRVLALDTQRHSRA